MAHATAELAGSPNLGHDLSWGVILSTHFVLMITEKWVLPLFMKAGLQPVTTSTSACTDIECACCQICNYPGGYVPSNSKPPYLDMCMCDVCQQTYHWKCMNEYGRYTEGQRQEIDPAYAWASRLCRPKQCTENCRPKQCTEN
eukprot:1149284-Pelagomonas_calceolata.AAC.1